MAGRCCFDPEGGDVQDDAEHGDTDDDEMADREERLCSKVAEKAAQRDYGELSSDDLQVKKIDIGAYVGDPKRKVHFMKLSLDHDMVCAFLHRSCMDKKK